MNSSLLEIIYCSRETTLGIEPADPKIGAILTAARRINERLRITGALMFNAGCFVQLLEGPVGAVDQLFERIRTDPRHHDVVVLSRRPVSDRLFPDWAMGFVPTHEEPAAKAAIARAFASAHPASADDIRLILQHSTATAELWGT